MLIENIYYLLDGSNKCIYLQVEIVSDGAILRTEILIMSVKVKVAHLI